MNSYTEYYTFFGKKRILCTNRNTSSIDWLLERVKAEAENNQEIFGKTSITLLQIYVGQN